MLKWAFVISTQSNSNLGAPVKLKYQLSLVATLALFANVSAFGAKFGFELVAPAIYDRSTIVSPPAGSIIFDSNSGGFYGAATNGLWQALGNQSLGYVTATSSVISGSTYSSGDWMTFSDGSVTLAPGTWMLNGTVQFGNDGTTPGYTAANMIWSSAAGSGSSTAPTAMTTDAGATRTFIYADTTGVDVLDVGAQSIRVTVTSSTTVWLVPQLNTTGANTSHARVTTVIYAQQLK